MKISVLIIELLHSSNTIHSCSAIFDLHLQVVKKTKWKQSKYYTFLVDFACFCQYGGVEKGGPRCRLQN